MKTAMQEWFDELKANYPYMANEIFDKGFNKYLEKEKEQIMAAVRYGQNNHEENVYEEGELYYNEIYNSDAPIIKSSIPSGNIEVTKTNNL
jgi:hypothetical protein